MTGLVEPIRQVLHALRKRRWLALGVAAVVAALCAAVLTEVPDRYRAKARVYVDTQTVLKPLMTGLTYQPDIDQQVTMLARTLISRSNVERLLATPELGLDAPQGSAREELIADLMQQIKVLPAGAGNLYEISYKGTTPDTAQRLVRATLDLFTSASTGAKRRDSEDAGRFIDEQIRGYEAKLADAENRLKEYKVRHFGDAGVPNQDYFARVSALTEDVARLSTDLKAAEQTRDTYRRELATEEPQLPPELAPRASVAATPETQARIEAQARLEAQRQRLEELLGRFTEAHPEIAATRRSLAQLEATARERKAAEERANARYGKAATSPIYQRLRILLAESEAQVASLRSQLTVKQQRLEQVRAVAGRMPQVEAELAQLNRDYDVIRKNYDQLVARRESAALGMRLDESAQLAEFRVIEPPRVSTWPAFPGRLHLAVLALLLAPGLGIAAAVVVERMHPTVDDAQALRRLSGRPVAGTVSWLPSSSSQRRQRLASAGFAVALAGLLTLQMGWLGWAVVAPALRQAVL
jgi:polysaccharide chain length determinant protein (PEP-CTERM system associated)